jgi:hypothetical protein
MCDNLVSKFERFDTQFEDKVLPVFLHCKVAEIVISACRKPCSLIDRFVEHLPAIVPVWRQFPHAGKVPPDCFSRFTGRRHRKPFCGTLISASSSTPSLIR